MSDQPLHPLTKQQIEAFQANPGQSLLLVGPSGSGKRSLAIALAEVLLQIEAGSLDGHAYVRHVQPVGSSIGIEQSRELEKFLSLKVPSKATHNRVIIIEDAHAMTTEAQNALLKTIEEPPTGTVLLLTASHTHALLPTILSRVQQISVRPPSTVQLASYLMDQKHDPTAVQKALAMSGGLPGLTTALLSQDDHPLAEAAQNARSLLTGTNYQRLILIDALAKQRQLAIDTLTMLGRIAHLSVEKASGSAADKWLKIMRAAYEAQAALEASGQPKLVLTNMVMHF